MKSSPAPPKVIRQTYQVKSMTTDGLNRLSALTFEVQFDQALAVSGIPLVELSQSELSPVMLGFFDVYSPMPMNMAGLLGLTSLECGGEVFISTPYDDGTLDEQELIPVPSTGDPQLGFFNSFHIEGSTNFRVEMPVMNDTISVLLMLEDSRECDPYVGCLFAVGLASRLTDVDFGGCRLHFTDGYNVLDPTKKTVLHGIGSETDLVGEITVTGFLQKESQGCDYFSLDTALDNFEQATSYISGTDFAGLSASFWRAAAFALADPIISCQILLNEFLTPIVFTGFEETDRCLLGESDEAYLEDPCCNKELRWKDECCAARVEPYSFPSANLTNGSGYVMGTEGCHHRYILKSAIRDYLAGLDDNINPATGCSASAQKIASPELFDAYFRFVPDCNDLLFSYPFCTSDADCYTYCFSQQCEGAWNSSLGGLEHTECFADQMHPTVASILKLALGVPGASRDEFIQAMIDQLWDSNCNGGELYEYTFIPDSTQPFGFDYVQSFSEDVCLSLFEVCHNDYFANTTDCGVMAGDSVDHMCAQCYGTFCVNMYLPSRCTYTGVDVAGCEALGGIYEPDFNFAPCRVPGITSEAQCLPSNICPSQESPDKLPRRYFLKQRCETSFCYLSGVTSPSGCLGTCADPLFWEPDPGICKVAVSNQADCIAAAGVWFH